MFKALMLTVKHLPGQHDQHSHGRLGGSTEHYGQAANAAIDLGQQILSQILPDVPTIEQFTQAMDSLNFGDGRMKTNPINLKPETEMLIEPAEQWLAKHVGVRKRTPAKLFSSPKGGSYQDRSRIYLDETDSERPYLAGNTVHEYAHWVTTPKINQACRQFLKARTKSRIILERGKRGKITYADDFADAYTGTQYTKEKEKSTEIFSMGLQHMYENPALLYHMDRPHFLLTLGMMSGKF